MSLSILKSKFHLLILPESALEEQAFPPQEQHLSQYVHHRDPCHSNEEAHEQEAALIQNFHQLQNKRHFLEEFQR